MSNVTKRNRIFLISVMVLAALLIAGAAVYLTQIPDVSQQLSAGSSRLTVRIINPNDKSHWMIGMPIPIFVNATGDQPIQSVELWVDGNLMQSENTSHNPMTLTWMIRSLGEHTLLVRVKDSHGDIANSNAVRVIGIEQNLAGMYAIYKAKPGDTVAKLATSYGTTPQNILGMNPNLNSASPIPDGTNVKIPAPIPPSLPPQPLSGNNGNSPAPNTPTQKPTSVTPNPYLFWVSKFTLQNPPHAPDLALNVNNCSVNVLITNNANNAYGLYIYRLDPNSQTFHRVATLAPNSNAATPIEYADPKLYGSFSYYVSAFNAKGETPSKISEVQITDSACQSPYWSGLNLQQETNSLTLTKYDKAYFYLEVNNQSWGRVPQDPNAFLSLKNGVFNANDQINAYLKPPAQGQETVELDAWGWQGGSLVHIGNFMRTLSAGPSSNPMLTYTNPTINVVQLGVCQHSVPICLDFQTTPAQFGPYQKVIFQWAAPPGTYGIYQVWSFPLLEQKCPADDAGLLQSGLVGEQNGSNTFTVDFTQLDTQATAFSIRVVALDNNGQSVCDPSNVVQVSFNPPPTGQMPDPYTIQIKSINPGQLPNPSKTDCVVLTKNDFYGQQVDLSQYDDLTAEWIGWYEPWPVGTELCPPAYQPPNDPCADSFSLQCAGATLSGEGNLVENGWDQLSQDFATAKSSMIGEVEGVTGCNSDLCNKIITAGVDAGLAELGIPPSVPNSTELKQDGESYIADQMLDQAGVSCADNPTDTFCTQLGQWGHDQAKQQIVNALDKALQQNQQSEMDATNCQSTDVAHSLGIQYFMCVPPAITGQVQWMSASDSTGTPTVATLEIARDPNVPDSALPDSYSCSFKISSSAKNDSYIGKEVFLDGNLQLLWTGTELTDTDDFNLSGLFHTASGSIPKNVSFVGVQVPMMLTPRSDAYPQADGYWIVGSGHWEYDFGNDSYGDPDDWAYLYRGADATFTVTESCSSSAGSFTDAPKDQQTISINK